MVTLSQSQTVQVVDREELIRRAYKAIGYRPSGDHMIINDRKNALRKKTDAELLELINTPKG